MTDNPYDRSIALHYDLQGPQQFSRQAKERDRSIDS